MAVCPPLSPRMICGASILALGLAAGPALAESIFTPASDEFTGDVRAGAAEQGAPLLKGGAARVEGQGLVPGQTITLMRGTTVLNEGAPITVDAEGKFSFDLTVDAEAATGLHPIVVIAENPAAAEVVTLKVSPQVPVSGAENFEIKDAKVTRGLYQVIYSPASDAVYVTSAVGRPPVRESALVRIDPETLEIEAQATPPEAPMPARAAPPAGGQDANDTRPALFATYGVAVDDENGHVWVTNTRQDTVAVYKQDDLSLVKQFEPGAVNHARDVVVDEGRDRVYASSTMTGNIEVFDSKTLEKLDPIVIESAERGEDFSVMALDVDPESGTLVTVSMTTDELAVVDLGSGEVKVHPLPGAVRASGVAYDPKEDLAFVASQETDNLLIVKAATGEVLHDVDTGAGALNVTFEPVSRLAFVANRGAGTITAVGTDGKVVANIDAGTYPNQLRADGKGNVWAVNKSRGENDEEGDRIWKISPKAD